MFPRSAANVKGDIMALKAKYWTGVCYPENMRDDWQDVAEDLLGVPFAYCVHDKDTLQSKSDIIEHDERKVHVHFLPAFSNTTTEKHALETLNKLSKPDRVCCPKVFPVNSIRKMYDYLIHDTNNCRKQGKYLYDISERICCNNFDIGSYEQISLEEKNQLALELAKMITDMELKNFTVFQKTALMNYPENERLVIEVIKSNSGYFDRLVRGNYYLEKEQNQLQIDYEKLAQFLMVTK